ncbi:MAG TPA: glycosyltransferase family 4 protein [Patescibacteria group bacterium]|jgi:glycosyltransferase involved in cell wall biosynthesis
MARILVITPSYSPRLGGVEKHVWYTSLQLVKAGWSVTILTQRFTKLPAREVKKNIPIYRFTFPARRFIGLLVIWKKLTTSYWRLVSQADIIHIHDVFIWYLPLRLIFFWKPVVTTFHGWEGIFPVPRKNIFLRQLAVLLSNKTVAIGRYLEKYYHFKADKILYGAVDFPAPAINKQNLLLYVGRLDYDTGLPVLLQVLKDDGWSGRVVFCGDGILKEQAEAVGEVKGFVDPRPYLKKAQVVFAGGYLSILEAFAYRCTVTAAEKNPLKKDYYLMSPFAAWISVAGNAQDLAHWLKVVQSNPQRIKRLVNQANNWVKNKTWSSVTNEYLKLYK